VLWSANPLSAGPEVGARAAVAVLVSLGVGPLPGGIAAVRRFHETEPRPGRLDAAPAGSLS
jgi:hypothetical protein